LLGGMAALFSILHTSMLFTVIYAEVDFIYQQPLEFFSLICVFVCYPDTSPRGELLGTTIASSYSHLPPTE
jgi:hypothetical protein